MKLFDSFKKLKALRDIEPGDIFRYKDYHFVETGEVRNKYIFIACVDKEDDSVTAFLTTSNGKFYNRAKRRENKDARCFAYGYHNPCYVLVKGESCFKMETFLQFANTVDESYTELKSRLDKDQIQRQTPFDDTRLLKILKCIKYCDKIDRYSKSLIEPHIENLTKRLHPKK